MNRLPGHCIPTIRNNADTHSGRHLRRFIGSIRPAHHALNLRRMEDVLDSQHNAWVTEVFTALRQGSVSETALRTALLDSEEIDRWDTVRLLAPEQRRVADALDAVTDQLKTTPPGAPTSGGTQAAPPLGRSTSRDGINLPLGRAAAASPLLTRS